MKINQSIFGMMMTIFGCSIAMASNMDLITPSERFHPVVSLQGGYASINSGRHTQRFTGTDADLLTYTPSVSHKNTDFIGAFLGMEHIFPWVSRPGFFVQSGIEYNYFSNVHINGLNTVGIEPESSTQYHYRYRFQTQQILGTIKLFATAQDRYHPYGEVGLGAALSNTGQYDASTTETGSLNLTPWFRNQTETQLSYSLGLGMDVQVDTNIRVGLGYRYSNFGTSSLGKGSVTFDNYQSPTPFTLNANTDMNQLIAHISYII